MIISKSQGEKLTDKELLGDSGTILIRFLFSFISSSVSDVMINPFFAEK